MNLTRLLVLSVVFSALTSVSSFAASGGYFCVSSDSRSDGASVEAFVSGGAAPTLTVMSYLSGEAAPATEVLSFGASMTDLIPSGSQIVAKGFESSPEPMAMLGMDPTLTKSMVVSSRAFGPIEGSAFPGTLTIHRGFFKDSEISMFCTAR
ncbi:MAG: hypothetical protein H7301_08640 [Cryobacterium sp.]|nr:hypothetical protein [Oligoflexia bacterium]